MAVAHDANTRFPAGDPAPNLNNVDTTSGDRSFTHTPSGTPAGVVAVVTSDAASQPCTGVTYGGISMTLRASSTDTSETGSVHVWTLTDVAIPTGAQTVVLQGCLTSGKFATISTVTSSTDLTTYVGASSRNTTLAAANNLSVVITLEAMLYGGIHSGQAAVASVTVIANYTAQNNTDYGIHCAVTSRSTSPLLPGTVTYGFNQGSDDHCMAVAAVAELAPPRYAVTSFQNPAVI